MVTDPGIEIAGEVTADALDAGVEALVGEATVTAVSPAPVPAQSGGSPTPVPTVSDDSSILFGFGIVEVAAVLGAVVLLATALLVNKRRRIVRGRLAHTSRNGGSANLKAPSARFTEVSCLLMLFIANVTSPLTCYLCLRRLSLAVRTTPCTHKFRFVALDQNEPSFNDSM